MPSPMEHLAAKEHAPKISRTALTVATWALFGLSFCFYVARLVVRWTVSHRFFLDDAWATSAIILLLASSIILTLAIPSMYMVLLVVAGLEQPKTNFLDTGTHYLKLQFALTLLFWTCLWSVKACFLAFFLRLTSGLFWVRKAWWCLCGFTFLTYVTSVVTYPIACASFALGGCETSQHIYRSAVSLQYSTSVDVITDAMIIALPLYLALKVRLPAKQKLALGAVFSLGLFVMIFAIVRIAVTNSNSKHPDPTWLNLWSQVEAAVAIIVSSLAPFRVFFTQRRFRMSEAEKSPVGDFGSPVGSEKVNEKHDSGDASTSFHGTASRHPSQQEDLELGQVHTSERIEDTRSVNVESFRTPFRGWKGELPAVMKTGIARFVESREDL